MRGSIMDGWRALNNTALGTLSIGSYQTATAIFPGFAYLLQGTTGGTPLASPAAGDAVFYYQPIEGTRVMRLAWGTANAQPITLAFWSAHHRPGLYSLAIRNGASNRSYWRPTRKTLPTYRNTTSLPSPATRQGHGPRTILPG